MRPRRGAFRRLAWAAAAATLALITLGGVVRITGSGMGCGDEWPLCRGGFLPPLDAPALIEYGHRLAAALVSLLVLTLCGLAWTRHRSEARLRRPATLAAVLLVTQIVLGAAAVWLRLAAASVVLHLATAMALLAVLTVAALRASAHAPAGRFAEPHSQPQPYGAGFRALARACTLLGFSVVVMGGIVANLDAGPACRGFPLCNGTLLPEGDTRVALHWLHRLLAFGLVGLLGVTFVAARRIRWVAAARRLAAGALGVALLQVALAAAMVLHGLPAVLRAAHLGLGALVFALLVALDHYAQPRVAAGREPVLSPSGDPAEAEAGRAMVLPGHRGSGLRRSAAVPGAGELLSE